MSDTGDVVKNVAAVPSGPTKLKGPLTELEPAAWKRSVVFAGVVPFQERVDQIGVRPAAGLLSFGEETRLPLAAKPVCMYVLNPASVVCPEVSGAVHVVPLSVEETLWPPA